MPAGSGGSVGTNPQRFLHNYHWGSGAEVDLDAAATPESLGAAVATGRVRRIREITVRHAGSGNTVITLGVNLGDANEEIRLTFDVPAQTTRVWSSEDGRSFSAGEQPEVQTSNVTGGHSYVTAAGIEA